jgi:hypothetical protein
MGLVAGQDGAIDGYEAVPLRPSPTAASRPAAVMFRRRSAQPSRRGVLHLQTARDAPVAPDLARWYTERGFHFYVAALPWPGQARQRGGKVLAAAFTELDARCEHLRETEGIDNVIVTAHGEGALAAALWCAGPDRAGPDRAGPGRAGQDRAGQGRAGQADALILYAPSLGRPARRGLDIPCPVLVIGGPGTAGGRAGRRRGRRAEPVATVDLGRHVTWLRPTDGEARPDAREERDRARFFDEMGRWLGAYMYGEVRDQLL